MSDERRLLLYVNLDFPPMSWAGVWRALGFVKYLPEHGYDVHVLCGDLSPGWTRYDPALVDQVPADHVRVRRLRGPFLGDFHRFLDRRIECLPSGRRRRAFTWMKSAAERYYPEAHLLWVLRTLVRASLDVRRRRPAAVMTSGPPHLTHTIGLFLQRMFGLPWIADFRDPWMDDPAQRAVGYRGALFQYLERQILAKADAVVTVSPVLRQLLDAHRRAGGGRTPVAIIANGHDIETEIPWPPPPRAPGPLRLFFNGSPQAGSRCYSLLEGLCIVGRHLSPDEMPRVSFPGLDEEFHWHVRALGLGEYVPDVGVLSHARCLEVACAADVLLVLVKDTGPASRGVLPTKVYEAIALGRRILAVTPRDSDLRDLLADNPLATCCGDDADEIAAALLALNDARRRDQLYPEARPPIPVRHSRRDRTRQLAHLLDVICDINHSVLGESLANGREEASRVYIESGRMSTLPPRTDPRDPERDPKAVEGPRRLSVLVVDDMEEVRKLYARYFGFHGLNVMTAADGFEALEATARVKPDVIVLDMSLPRMTGWEMLERLRADPTTRDIPVVVLTGALFAGSQGDAFRAGADSYLAKPCLPGVVLAEIVRLTGGPGPSQA